MITDLCRLLTIVQKGSLRRLKGGVSDIHGNIGFSIIISPNYGIVGICFSSSTILQITNSKFHIHQILDSTHIQVNPMSNPMNPISLNPYLLVR